MESIIPILNMVLIDKFDVLSPYSSFDRLWKYVLEQKEIKTLNLYIQLVFDNFKDERSIQIVTLLSAIAEKSSNIIVQLYLYKSLRQMLEKNHEVFESKLNHLARPLIETLTSLEYSIKFKITKNKNKLDSTG